MAGRILFALTPTRAGEPACLLLDDGGRPLIARLVDQLTSVTSQGDVEVAVVTRERWADRVRAVLPATTVVRGVRSHGDAVRAVLALATGEVVLAHAHLVTGELALGRIADGAARGTAAVVGPVDLADGSGIRVARGRILAAASAHHRLVHAGATARRALRIGAADRDRADPRLAELADLLDTWLPDPPLAFADDPTVTTAASPPTQRRPADVADPAPGADGGADPSHARVSDHADPPRGTVDGVDPSHARVSDHAGPPGAASDAAPGAGPDAIAGMDPADDLVAFVLVALVRGGIPVAATALPAGSVWTHPRDRGEVAAATAALASLDEERQRLDAAVKADDGFFTTFLVSSYSRFWARWAARRGFTPNQVSTVSMLLGILSASAFAVGRLTWTVLGAVLLQLAFTLDCVDGQLARYTRRFSALGAWLDSVFDRGKEYVVYAGLAVGGLRAGDGTDLWLLAGAALALQTFRHTLDLGYAEQQLADLDAAVVGPLAPADERGPSFWEAAAAPTSTRPAAAGGTSLPRRVVGLLRRAEAVAPLRWAKRIVVLPIGERFALISLVAVLAGPRAVFLALLVWGGLATAYTAGGRVVRSFA